MKLIKKIILLIVLFVPCICLAKGYVSVSRSTIDVYVGDSASFNVVANTSYAVIIPSISGGSASVSETSKFDLDEESKTISVRGLSVGTTTITFNCTVATYDTEEEYTDRKVVTINVIERPTTTTTTRKKTTTTTTTTQQGEVKGEEVTSTTEPITVVTDYNLNISIVGYDIDFNKNTNTYTINIDKDVNELYVNVTGDDVTASGNNIIDIKDKDKFDVIIKHNEEELKYTFNINRKTNNTVVKNNDNVTLYKILLLVAGIIIVVETGIIIYICKKNKNNMDNTMDTPIDSPVLNNPQNNMNTNIINNVDNNVINTVENNTENNTLE